MERDVFSGLRTLCRTMLRGFTERMEYGMPCYMRASGVEVAFARQKNYVALYILNPTVVKKHASALKGLSTGKGCIRFANPQKLDFELIENLLQSAAAAQTKPC